MERIVKIRCIWNSRNKYKYMNSHFETILTLINLCKFQTFKTHKLPQHTSDYLWIYAIHPHKSSIDNQYCEKCRIEIKKEKKDKSIKRSRGLLHLWTKLVMKYAKKFVFNQPNINNYFCHFLDNYFCYFL